MERRPGETFAAYASGFVAKPFVRIERADGTTHTARTDVGVLEVEPGSKRWGKPDLVAPGEQGEYLLLWDRDGVWADEELVVAYTTPAVVAAAGPGYATPAELRAELEIEVGDLTDDAAERLLRTAERRVDRLLGPRPRDPDTGRKLVPSLLHAAQARDLRDATVLLAGAEHRAPAAFSPAAGERVKGPDFEVQGAANALPAGQAALIEAAALLANAGLRRLHATLL